MPRQGPDLRTPAQGFGSAPGVPWWPSHARVLAPWWPCRRRQLPSRISRDERMRGRRRGEAEMVAHAEELEEAQRGGNASGRELGVASMVPARSGDEKSEGGRAGDNKRGRGASE